MWVKICGTTNLRDAQLALDAGADALGFIFAPSRRQMTPAQARSIVHALPPGGEYVGVFTSGSAAEIGAVVQEASLTAVQLHMHFAPERLQELRALLGSQVKVLQVVTVQIEPADPEAEQERFQQVLREVFLQDGIFAVLIDAAQGAASGGRGRPMDWSAAAVSVQAAQHHAQLSTSSLRKALPHIVLAGGLRAENVQGAIAVFDPWGVDVVSGVEASPGRKDQEKLVAFLRKAKPARSA